MDNHKARFILQSCRPDGRDTNDAGFAEAWAVTRENPELAARLAEERVADQVIASRLKSIPVPADLQARLLAGMEAQNSGRRHRRVLAVAIAASVLILLSIAGAWMVREHEKSAAGFANYRNEMVGRLDERLHLSFTSERPVELQQWLETNRGITNTVIPAGLQSIPGIGCRTWTWNGRPAGLICFLLENGQAVHLIVVSDTAVSRTPQGDAPEWKQIGGWQTASWSRDGNTYVLAGRLNRESLEKLL